MQPSGPLESSPSSSISQGTPSTSLDDLPIELVFHILSMLPVTQLNDLRLVRRSWNQIIIQNWDDDLACLHWSTAGFRERKYALETADLLAFKRLRFARRLAPLIGNPAGNALRIQAIPKVDSPDLSITAQGLAQLPQDLVRVHLTRCVKLTDLSPLLRLTQLSALKLVRCPKITQIPAVAISLRNLKLVCCPKISDIPTLTTLLQSLTLHALEGMDGEERHELAALSGAIARRKAISHKLPSPLKALPMGLTSLEVRGYPRFSLPPHLPSRLDTLKLDWLPQLKSLPALPAGLKGLTVVFCESLTSLPSLPTTLQLLYLTGDRSLSSIPSLPSNLYALYLDGCAGLKQLPSLSDLSQNLWLHIAGTGLRTVPSLPQLGESTLEVRSSPNLEELPTIPEGITDLICFDCKNLRGIASLPSTLTSLDVSGCRSLEQLPPLPPRLQKLRGWRSGLTRLPKLELTDTRDFSLYDCNRLVQLPTLPKRLVTLTLGDCPQLKEIGQLPDTLEWIWVYRCSHLERLPKLPSGLKRLQLSDCPSLVTTPELPQSLQELSLEDSRFTQMPTSQLPILKNLTLRRCMEIIGVLKVLESLESLSLEECPKVTGLSWPLPQGLTSLTMIQCSSLQSLPGLPASLLELELEGNQHSSKPPPLPPKVKKLSLSQFSGITGLFKLASVLEALTLFKCPGVTRLSNPLPPRLRILDLSESSGISSLPTLPSTLTHLNLNGLKQLRSIPGGFPTSVSQLSLKGCSEIRTLPEFPSGIGMLTVTGCPAFRLQMASSYASNLTYLDMSCPSEPASLEGLSRLESLGLQLQKGSTTLPRLPHTVTDLGLFGHASLSQLPNIPSTITCLWLSDWPNLRQIGQPPTTLSQLNLANCPLLGNDSLTSLPLSLEGLRLTRCPGISAQARTTFKAQRSRCKLDES